MGLRPAIILLSALCATKGGADFAADEFPPYERCALCHGLFGVSHTAKFPNLGGQDPVYLEAQIRAFLDGKRTNDGGQMVAIVTELKPEEIPVVVEWFSSQDAPEPTPAADPETGKLLYTEAGCADCHNLAGELEGVPHLTSQHPGYLAKQMRNFRDGERLPGAMDVPHQAVIPGEDTAIDAIAAFLGAEPRP